MEYKKALNKTLALILWAKEDNDEDDAVVYPGIFVKKGAEYFLERKEGKNPKNREEWLERIKSVPKDMKETLMDCEYYLSLTVGDAPKDAKNFKDFDLKWPD